MLLLCAVGCDYSEGESRSPLTKATRWGSSYSLASRDSFAKLMNAEHFDAIQEREKGLHRGLTSAQLTMIAIGGEIGTGPVSWQQFCDRLCRACGNRQLRFRPPWRQRCEAQSNRFGAIRLTVSCWSESPARNGWPHEPVRFRTAVIATEQYKETETVGSSE